MAKRPLTRSTRIRGADARASRSDRSSSSGAANWGVHPDGVTRSVFVGDRIGEDLVDLAPGVPAGHLAGTRSIR